MLEDIAQPVEHLTILQQENFAPLPLVQQGRLVVVSGTEWKSKTCELAASVLIQVCVNDRQWRNIRIDEAIRLVQLYASPIWEFERGVRELLRNGCIRIINCGGQVYIVPNPTMTYTALKEAYGTIEHEDLSQVEWVTTHRPSLMLRSRAHGVMERFTRSRSHIQ